MLSETTTKSKWEITLEATSKHLKSSDNIPHQLCDASRKHIQVVTCDKCGKLKRFVEDI